MGPPWGHGGGRDRQGAALIGLARSVGRYGHKRITALQMAGWSVNAKRVQRIWRAEGLKVPKRQPKRGRLWLADGALLLQRGQGWHAPGSASA